MTTLEQAIQKPEHIKVRLRYRTSGPTTETALILADHLGVKGPYLEEVTVLLPASRCFSLLDVYLEPFELLRTSGAVPQDSTLAGYRIEPGDQPTVLSYVIP